MKSTTERRLLFALLLSSLIPVVTLGFLAAAAVHRLGEAVEREAEEAGHARDREALGTLCRDAADRVEVFLRRREADLRALTLIPRTPSAYDAFRRTSLGPLRIESETGEKTQAWLPLYTVVSFIPAGEGDLVEASAPGALLPSAADAPPEAEFVAQTLSLAPDEVSFTAAPQYGQGAVRLALAVRSPHGQAQGVASVVLDPRQLAGQLPPPGGNLPSPPEVRDAQLLFFFHGAGTTVVGSPGPLPASLEQCLAESLPEAAAAVRVGETAVVAPYAPTGPLRAFAPLRRDGRGGDPEPEIAGGVLLCSQRPAAPPAASRTLADRAETRIGVLTLAATFGVALAALLVARRMSGPWVRLREKARSVSSGSGHGEARDELDEISRSFDSLASRVAASDGLVRASEARLREFLEMSPDGIAVVDPHGRFLHFNRSLCQILRRAPSQLAGLNSAELWARPGDRERMLQKLREHGRLRNYEVELVRGDGKAFAALLSVRLGTLGEGECLDVILRDVSDWKAAQRREREQTEALFRVHGELSQAHRALRRAYDEVEEQVRRQTSELRSAYEALQTADRVKTEFLMKMSHELRTPLNCIIGYSEAMGDGLDGPVTPDQNRSLERIAQSGRRLLRMIEDLLDLSRLEAGRLDIVCAEMRLEDVLEDLLHQARSLVGEKPVRLELAVEEPLPPVWADADRVRQVLFNLLGNAVKFTAQGWVRVEARRRDATSIVVCVRDTGRGIPPEHLDSVFEKFTQIPGADRTGAGLGLAISREIVERMGGRIWVESELHRGSCFGFTLPVRSGAGQLALPLEGTGQGA
jgi:PAS domain S-box-containing protein